MSEKAVKVWKIAKKYNLEIALEAVVDDLEAFAEEIQGDNELSILYAICERLTGK